MSTYEQFQAVKSRGATPGATDAGVPMLGIRKDVPADLAGADGKYTMPQFDATGNLRTVAAGGGDASAANQATQITAIGALTETAPVSDTASSGLNGRLQRIAQRLTSLIALIPQALGQGTKAQSMSVTLASNDDLLAKVGEVQASPTANTVLDRLKALLTSIVLAAGTNLIGKVGIDQTTPGTTNLVTAGAPAVTNQSATISNGTSISGQIDLGAGRVLSTIHVPASFEGGYIEFDVAPSSGGTYQAMKDTTGAAIRYTAASSTTIRVDPQQFLGVQFLKLRSTDSGGSNTSQTGDAVIPLVAA